MLCFGRGIAWNGEKHFGRGIIVLKNSAVCARNEN